MAQITKGNMKELLGYIGIELAFALAFISLALVIGKRKQLEAEV
jgi:hypothetical protein